MSNAPALTKINLDADGDTHAIYELPKPVAWVFRFYNAELDKSWREIRLVVKVRVCLSLASYPALSAAIIVVPFDRSGQEHPLSARVYNGAQSMLAGLNRIGFPPELGDN